METVKIELANLSAVESISCTRNCDSIDLFRLKQEQEQIAAKAPPSLQNIPNNPKLTCIQLIAIVKLI